MSLENFNKLKDKKLADDLLWDLKLEYPFECNYLSASKDQYRHNDHLQRLLQLWRHYTCTNFLSTEDFHRVQSLASEICALLMKTNSDDALKAFVKSVDIIENFRDENVIIARIRVALFSQDPKTAKMLLKENCFESDKKEELIKLWDEALYIEEERRTGKKLTALTRFRVRKRYPPPPSICNDGIRKTCVLPRESTAFLKQWLLNHIEDPYPTRQEKQQLATLSGLTTNQVKTWFANARRRSKSTDEFRKRCEHYTKTSAATLDNIKAVQKQDTRYQKHPQLNFPTSPVEQIPDFHYPNIGYTGYCGNLSYPSTATTNPQFLGTGVSSQFTNYDYMTPNPCFSNI